MSEQELFFQNISRIVSSLGLTETIQKRVILELANLSSFSKRKSVLLKELYLYSYDVDSIEPEINQMLAFGILRESGTSAKLRLSLVKELWKFNPDNIEVIVKAIKAIANKHHDYGFNKIVNEVRKNLVRYKLIDQVLDIKTLKIITTCSLIRGFEWGFVDGIVIRVDKNLTPVLQDSLFTESISLIEQIEMNPIFSKEIKMGTKKIVIKKQNMDMPMISNLSKILTVAQEILSLNKSGMHVDAIALEAVNTNRNMSMTASDMSKKLSQVLSQNVKSKNPVFARVLNKKNGKSFRGFYRLKQTRIVPLHKKIETPQVDTGYFGKAGEYAVSSELLFWGYNVSLMAVDQGVDLVASKEGRYYHLQVKTATPQSQADGSTKYQFTILEKTFTANHNSTMWYVFVLRKKASNDYVIMASSELLRQRNSGLINGKDFSVKISSADKGKHFLMSGKVDINSNINNFALIV